MNWRRGFWRLWIVLTALYEPWMGYMLYQSNLAWKEHEPESYAAKATWMFTIKGWFFWLLVIPLLVLALGWLVGQMIRGFRWAIRGFKADGQ